MPRTRPYSVRLQGTTRLVEATSREAAIGHCTKPLIEDCHAATAREVMEFARGGGTIETAGVYPAPEGPLPLRYRSERVILEDGAEWAPGDTLVPLGEGGTYRRPEEGEDTANAIVVGEGAEIQAGNQLVWKVPHERAPDDAVARDGHSVQTAAEALAGGGGSGGGVGPE